MSSGSRTQAAFIQGIQSTADQEAPHSALLYLLQEVSRLASPTHSRGGSPMVKEDGDEPSFSISNSTCQHSLSSLSNYNQIDKVKQESHSIKDTDLVNLRSQCNSPWKVLSLINLQCERLLNPSNVEESDSGSSVIKFTSIDNALTKIEQGSHFLYEMHKTPVHVSFETDGSRICSREVDKPECCVKKDPHTAEDPLRSELVEDKALASSHPHLRDADEEKICENRQFSLNQEYNNVFSSTGNIFNVVVTGNISSKLSFNSLEETSEILPKPALTLDHNANIIYSPEHQSAKQLPPLSVVLSAAQSLLLNTTQNDHSHSQQDDKLTAAKLDCPNDPSEDKSLPVAQTEPSSDSGETDPLDSATPGLESWSVHQEEVTPAPAKTWRTKTLRKQLNPSKSVDIQDPDFQGVTFRMDTELDDSKEQCRLLITSKYSKEFHKSVRKPRMRRRRALKSLRTISSEEESDPVTSVSTGGKVCASCCTRKTPMWRDAEDGTPLCNACGIRFKKYRVRCVNCWHIPRKESNSNSRCLKCGNSLKLTSAHRKHTA